MSDDEWENDIGPEPIPMPVHIMIEGLLLIAAFLGVMIALRDCA